MAANNMNNLTTLIKRLEAATSRLEDIASTSFGGETGTGVPALDKNAPTSNSLPAAAAADRSPPPVIATDSVPPVVSAYNDIIDGELKAYLVLSKQLGGVVNEQAQHVAKAFIAQRQFILLTTKAKNPGLTSPAFAETLKDTTQEMMKVDEVRNSNRDRSLKNHLSLVADGIGALGWVTTEKSPKPHEYVNDLFGGAQIFGNNVLKEFKDKDRTQVEWVQSYYKLFKALTNYAREHHPTAVQWNANGIDAAEAARQIKNASTNGTSSSPPSAPAPSGGVPPPPPPPGPPPPPVIGDLPPAPSGAAGGAGLGAVFSELNRGSDVTKGLKKVDPSQMTHKNPSLRTASTVPERKGSDGSLREKSPVPGKKPKPESLRQKKPARKELDGNKWIIENFENPSSPIEIAAEISHSVLISRCKNATLRITGKANAVSIDNSTRFNIVLDSLVSSVDVIKCPNFALQVLGTLPTVLMDQVDGAQIYLSAESLNTEVFTSKCSSVNVILPPKDESGEADYSECPVPEQIRSFVKNGKLVSEIVEHAG